MRAKAFQVEDTECVRGRWAWLDSSGIVLGEKTRRKGQRKGDKCTRENGMLQWVFHGNISKQRLTHLNFHFGKLTLAATGKVSGVCKTRGGKAIQ